jgi:hypothetical protein
MARQRGLRPRRAGEADAGDMPAGSLYETFRSKHLAGDCLRTSATAGRHLRRAGKVVLGRLHRWQRL